MIPQYTSIWSLINHNDKLSLCPQPLRKSHNHRALQSKASVLCYKNWCSTYDLQTVGPQIQKYYAIPSPLKPGQKQNKGKGIKLQDISVLLRITYIEINYL